ncbi:MAG: 2,3-bisphosphoglycerate-independent phosphoglycerate mutase [Flavobacteriales bacterium]|nr:2,3-bisphosphoglycerate-independent phosphoglycerate mutase [Flavobacteriales bacterium]MBK6944790.1 2,3-bisphosphoglycerate-independent phosphoglycerate mutase [Flavobacteriales bacterium]MBK7241061.1 2,3-bisphosphoglycerate-independent phosphoglycerate mutase [Flavobacteriales bacterium]MBK9534447.1 2,3-bisphosphoglycerate-independent phosphoglycerate mutase [Flavobacteriales bacterium]MBP9139226.1 2,3-bisphosphoglycerate-independent phosphoglycerate mutase [Flavobacteriales bacterium]
MTDQKVVLIVLDGWGLGAGDHTDAIAQAHTPFIDSLYGSTAHSTLLTDGVNVGLPEGQMGNSEVGHLNIGAGRIVYQDLMRVNKAIAEDTLKRSPVLVEAFAHAAEPGKRLHLIGLLSDGGVHSMRTHAEALCHMAHESGVKEIFVHAFTDGRDADPRSGKRYMEQFLNAIDGTGAKVASVVGRYYAMDRDKRWERVAEAYELLVHGKGLVMKDPLTAFSDSYADGKTDEFILPHVIVSDDGEPLATIRPNDVVICFNFRTDRCREITQALTQQAYPEYGMTPLSLHFVTMTEYDRTFKNVQVLFRKDDLQMTLGEVIEKAGKKQIRIAETEKYPHVTFFFSGGREKPFEGEDRIMIPSPKVATYDLQPEMSAEGITTAICEQLKKGEVDFVALNFANPDMVGHTGVFNAIVKAVETTDRCAERVVNAGQEHGYSYVIIADHGNADKALNADGTPNTAHSTNPVPVFVLDKRIKELKSGVLADVAPTILELMGIEKPAEMTGSSLILMQF